MKMKKIVYKTLLFLSMFAFYTSCEVGLGEGIDLTAPRVKVVTPQSNDTVAREITVKGNVSDNEAITQFILSVLEGNATSSKLMEFKWDGQWTKLDKDNGWIPFNNASWKGDNLNAQWSLTFEIENGESGKEYILEAKATDKQLNESKDSLVEVSIVLDYEQPSTTIISPNLLKSTTLGNTTFNKYWITQYTQPKTSVLQESGEVKNLVNGEFTIEGQIEEDTRLGTLALYIDDGSDFTVPSITDVPDFDTTNPLIKKHITNKTRDWAITITEDDFKLLDEVNPTAKFLGEDSLPQKLRIVTEATDNAGNRKRECQGFFIYWDAADKPWNVFNYGDESEKIITEQKQIYPGSSLQGQSYDDDGIASVKLEVYTKIDTSWSRNTDLSKTINLTQEEYPTYYGWSVDAPSDRMLFRVEIECTDTQGNKSDKITKYLAVNDINPPKFELTSPSTEDDFVALGDANGKFSISGNVSDDGQISSLEVIQISKDNQKKTNHIANYFDSDSDCWNNVPAGDRKFTITLPTPIKERGRYNYSFTKDFNIFSDFKVGTTETINSLLLIFKTTDNSGASTIEQYAFKGDTDAPVLNYTKVQVFKSDNTLLKEYDLTNDNIPTLDPFNRNILGKITDKIKFLGTWKDNSVKTSSNSLGWNKNGSNYRISDITLETKSDSYKLKIGDETWESDYIAPQDSTNGSVTVTVSDYAGNKATSIANYYVNANRPELARISSTNSDGSYKVGSTITIVLEFNKKVKYKSSNRISLKLNSGGTALFDNTNPDNATTSKSSSKHYFTYTIGNSDTAVDKLKVTQLVLPTGVLITDIFEDDDNTNIYVQGGGTVSPTTVLNNAINLDAVRSIKIDKIAPLIQSVNSITGEGYYNVGKELVFQVAFTKEVNIDNLANVQLNLAFNSGIVTLSNPTKTGSTTLLFKHTILNGQNASAVLFDSLKTINSTQIVDNAGNVLTNFTPQTIDFGSENSKINLVVDTNKPATPSIDASIINNSIIYDTNGISFVINNFETNSEHYYSLDDGTTWLLYNGTGVTLNRNGLYKIKAYQVDKAGNKSNESTLVNVTLDLGNVLKSITSKTSDGIYKEGKTISIILNFRKNINISNSKLKLNIKQKDNSLVTRYTNTVSKSNAKSVEYSYTIQDGDICDLLEVTDIEFDSIKDTNTVQTNLASYIGLNSANKLSESRELSILTGKPSVIANGIILDEETLKIKYDCEITKGTAKNITIQQASGYKAPAILSTTKYVEYSKTSTTIRDYYESSVNGSDENGIADVSEKYVLKYNYNTDNATLVSAFKSNSIKADTVVIPVDSVAVIIGSDKKTLEIDLSGTYTLPVKGATYNVTLDANLVQNALGTYSEANTGSQVILQGVEKPVIRVNKTGTTINANKAVQPLTATVKMDCQTPNATIFYKQNSRTFAPRTPDRTIFPETGSANTPMARQANVTTPTWTNEETYTNVLTVGSAADTQNGYKILIRARARVGNGDWSEDSYESANRTVVIFKNRRTGQWNQNGKTTVWIRGGDWKDGGVTTPNFPLSWDNKEYNKVNAMTNASDDDWYWVSWNVPSQVYFGFIAGNMPADAATDGPSRWTWATCGWVGLKELYPCYAGESIYMREDQNGNYQTIGGVFRGRFDYQEKHNESR